VQGGERGGDEDVHPSQQEALRNHIIEIELIEQLSLVPLLPTSPLPPTDLDQQESVFAGFVEHFFDSIDPKRTSCPFRTV
jgi:hypothetical protein